MRAAIYAPPQDPKEKSFPEESSGVTALIKTSLLGRNLKWLPVVEHELMACPLAADRFHRIASLSLSRRFDARERDGGKIKKKKKKKNEGSDLREKLMFSLESRLSVG